MLAAEFPTLGGGPYSDNKVADEFFWAAAELYLATGNPEYQKFYTAAIDQLSSRSLYWGGTAPLGAISLAMVGRDATA